MKPTAAPLDLALVLPAARQGDDAALGTLLARMRPYLFAIARTHGPIAKASRGETEDLVEETIVKAFRMFEQFQGTTVDELRGWLRRILVNGRRDTERHWRADRRQAASEVSVERRDDAGGLKDSLVAHVASPVAQLIRQEKIETIQAALAQLRPEHQDVISLRCQEDLPFDQVGQRLNRSGEAARKLWERACQDLKRRLQVMREQDSDFQDRDGR